MRIAVIGSGGLGGFFGAKLAQGGADVRFLARGAHLDAMRSNGLIIEGGPDATHVQRVWATNQPTEMGIADLVIFAVKLWDSEHVLEQISPIVGPGTTIISFQNGVLKDAYLKARYAPEQIMGGVGYVATTIDRPGVIRQTGPLHRLVFGEFDGRRSGRAEAFLHACIKGGIKAELSTNIQREIWEKFVFLVGLSATTTAMRSRIGPIRENPKTRKFLLDLMREVVSVGRARGIELPADYADHALTLADAVAPDMTSSMHHDLQRNKRLEVGWLSGGVALLAAEARIPAPLNRAVSDLLALYEAGSVTNEGASVAGDVDAG
jgi:2-dehydropantoate 2-reductase